MKQFQKIAIICFAFFMVNFSVVHSVDNPSKEMGRILSFSGAPFLTAEKSAKRIYFQEGAPVYSGQTLYTDDDSSVIVQLEDESIITVHKKSQIKFNREDKPEALDFNIVLDKGQSRFQVSKRNRLKQLKHRKTFKGFNVKTPTAYIGVRGTDFAVFTGIKAEQVGLADTDQDKIKKEITEVITFAEKTELELFSLSDEGEKIHGTIVRENKIYWVEKNKPPEEKNLDDIANEVTLHGSKIRYQLFSMYKGIGMQEKLEEELAIPDEPVTDEPEETLEAEQLSIEPAEESDSESEEEIIEIKSEVEDLEREGLIQKLPGYPPKPNHQI